MKKLLLITLLFFLFQSNSLLAQPGFDDDVEDTPIDGGLISLLIAGTAYGTHRTIKKSNSNYKSNQS